MAKCKICGKAVVTAHVFHRECWQDELEDKHCDSCDLIRVLNLGL